MDLNLSYNLAKILGAILIIIYGSLLVNRKYYASIFPQKIAGNPGVLFFSGLFTIIVAVVLIAIHNVWSMDWRVLITLFAWFMLFTGIVRILFPEHFTRFVQSRTKEGFELFLTIMATIFLCVGLLLAYVGFLG